LWPASSPRRTSPSAEEIVVTATRTPRLYAEVPVKTQIIGAREIEIRQATQLAESLAYTTGLRVETNCLNCNFTQVRINGMEGKYTQILIDNSPVFGSMVGVYGLEQIPAEMINRIEVVKGGGSALYGGNAVAGVINVLTKEPHENGASLSFQQEAIDGRPFSNFGFHSSLVSPSGTTKGFLFANARNRSPVDVNGDGFSEIGKLKGQASVSTSIRMRRASGASSNSVSPASSRTAAAATPSIFCPIRRISPKPSNQT
jgi:outer membrane receptor for ferrienterochelin and colicins